MLIRGRSGSGGLLFILEGNRAPPGRPFRQPGWGAEVGKKEGVHNVHTRDFGLGRMSAGLGRIGEVFGGVADIQGL